MFHQSVLILTCIVTSFQVTQSQVNPQNSRPNLVFIIADDLGFNDVGYTNATDVVTPNIDELAEFGIILKKFYSYPLCTPTRAAFLTGRYTFRYGFQTLTIGADQPYGLPTNPTEYTITEELHSAPDGMTPYRNYLIGKWHLGFSLTEYTPPERGFDEFYGIYNGAINRTHMETTGAGGQPIGKDFRDGQSKVDYVQVFNEYASDSLFEEGYYADDDWTRKAVEYIGEHQTDGLYADTPMFMMMSFVLPHSPYQIQDKFQTDPVDSSNRGEYVSMVANLDYNVGLIIDALKADELLWLNTYVVFLSDNGGVGERGHASNFPFRGHKESVWEGGVRVPAIVSGGALPSERSGTIYNELAHITDFFPTIMALTGQNATKSRIDGNDLSVLFDSVDLNDAPETRNEIILELDRGGELEGNPFCFAYLSKSGETDIQACGAIILDGYKLILSSSAADTAKWNWGGWREIPDQTPYDHWVQGDVNSDTRFMTCPKGNGRHVVPSRRRFITEYLNEDFERNSGIIDPAVGYQCPYDPSTQNTVGCLFNLDEDPCEINDLGSDDPMYTVLMERLYDLIDSPAFKDSLWADNQAEDGVDELDADGYWYPWKD